MSKFEDSYIGKIRALVGKRLLLVPAARVVVENDDGKVLLQLRKDLKIWGVPSGIAEEQETLVEVAIRELREETGLEANEMKPFGFACDPATETITFPNGDKSQFFSMLFLCRNFKGRAAESDGESLELRWFSLDDLPELLPNMARTIDASRRYLETGQFQMI